MTPEEIFENNADCWTEFLEDGGKLVEEQAMSKEKFIEVASLISKEKDEEIERMTKQLVDLSNGYKIQTNNLTDVHQMYKEEKAEASRYKQALESIVNYKTGPDESDLMILTNVVSIAQKALNKEP